MLCCTNLTCPSVIGCSRNQTLGYWGNLNAAILVLFCKNFYTTIIPVLILIVFFLKVAAAPLAVKKMEQKRVVNPLFEKRAKNFGIGQVSNQSTFNFLIQVGLVEHNCKYRDKKTCTTGSSSTGS